MRTVNMYEIGDKVLYPVEIADIKVIKGEIKYSLKDPLTAKCFDYLFTEDQIVSREENTCSKNDLTNE